jgi:RNA-directed DNA polymerase
MVWRWARRKHRKKNVAWRNQKYFKPHGDRRRVFTGEVRNSDGTVKQVRLYQAAKTPIVRHCKIKGAANPYDQEWELYFEERFKRQMERKLKGEWLRFWLWREQDGKCPVCAQKLSQEKEWNFHHTHQRVHGGGDEPENLVLLHVNCHRQVHNRGWKVSKPRPVKGALVEA